MRGDARSDAQPSGESYVSVLEGRFRNFRRSRYEGRDHLFEARKVGGPTVFAREHRSENVLVPPFATAEQRERIVQSIPAAQRHRHFGSMRSSQALAQSVVGILSAFGRLSMLSMVSAECGRPAFGIGAGESNVQLEKPIRVLGEPRPTSVDVWFDGVDRVAVECKLSESEFGTCSRPRLRPLDPSYDAQHCDGTYVPQRGRTSPCALTELGVGYWRYTEQLFGWTPDSYHRPCPLAATYQLVRNVMAACVHEDGTVRTDRTHALILYDRRNPAMSPGGIADRQWSAATSAMAVPGILRRLSWQSLLAQCPTDPVLEWLRTELDAKYGLG